jgi:hypothetical protein
MENKLFITMAVIALMAGLIGTTVIVGTAPISMAKNGHGVHGCDIGSQGFNSSAGKCFHNSTSP